jgi:hypothetical protein
MRISISARMALTAAALLIFIPLSSAHAITAVQFASSMNYQFMVDGTLQETGSMGETTSPYWWLSSGGKLLLKNGVGSTVQGSLASNDKWRTLYNASNPTDTDNGYHPQNIFRLVSRSMWDNARVDADYRINKDNFSSSPNRNQSNGLLQMLRYKDQHNLYYVGIRVDGKAIIKKKKNGSYTTLAEKQVIPGTYSIGSNVNLLPHGSWITLRGETVTNSDGSVTVRLYMKKAGESSFTKLLEAKDSSNPITGSGYVGIRTDFMDVEFDNIKATKI